MSLSRLYPYYSFDIHQYLTMKNKTTEINKNIKFENLIFKFNILNSTPSEISFIWQKGAESLKWNKTISESNKVKKN